MVLLWKFLDSEEVKCLQKLWNRWRLDEVDFLNVRRVEKEPR